jgi:Flp pilus assembly protein TadG
MTGATATGFPRDDGGLAALETGLAAALLAGLVDAGLAALEAGLEALEVGADSVGHQDTVA